MNDTVNTDKYAIVTGASSGIGYAIAKRLCQEKYTVYGIGRSFDPADIPGFHKVVFDMLQTELFIDKIDEIIDREERSLEILVNAAGVGYYGFHQDLSARQIQTMVRTNLEIPMILAGKLLPILRKNNGAIVNISSVTAFGHNPHGCAYGATKAGLSSFSSSIFDENRKHGLRVITVHPDMTKTSLYRNADFDVEDQDGCYLLPEDVADPIITALQTDHIGEMTITLRPQFHRIHKKDKSIKESSDEIYKLFSCTEAMKQILHQSLYYFSLIGIDYESEIERMKERGELPCRNKKEGMERIEQLKRKLII